MARSATYSALLDACVLYPAPVRDALLSLASSGLFHAKWSAEIESEWVENLLANRADLTRAQLEITCRSMCGAIPDCLIEHYDKLIPLIELPDRKDRHVVAAAIKAHVDAIVTYNLKDFPPQVLERYDIEAIHPDDFILNQLELAERVALTAIKAMRARLKNPPRTAEEFISKLEACQLPQTAAYLRGWSDLI
jgi:PIN domain